MKKTFKSKFELVIWIPIAIILASAEFYMISNKVWTVAAVIALISLFLIYLYLDTAYELTGDNKLRIKTGFLYNKVIYIQSIKRVKRRRNITASPALSHDRLEIFFNRYESVMISPSGKSDFIKQLKVLNPKIAEV
ncbi:MAG TPA: PH domain-containing protein [Flavisolibacter sp.]|nr:PH domain-containing protein [Flavisolibacter sp.]